MPRKRNARKPKSKTSDLMSAYDKGHDVFHERMEALLESGGGRLSTFSSVIRNPDIDAASMCLETAYDIAGTRLFEAHTQDSGDVDFRVDIFAFTVVGPGRMIEETGRSRAQDISRMFRKSGLFKNESNVIILGTPYSLSDLGQVSPQDVFGFAKNIFGVTVGVRRALNFPLPTFADRQDEDVAVTFIGAYCREWDEEGESDIFSGNFEARSDILSLISAYEKESADVFGDLCAVSPPVTFTEGVSQAVVASLDVMSEHTPDSFFVDMPETTRGNGQMTWTFRNSEGFRLCLDVPEWVGVLCELDIDEWALEHPAFMRGDDADQEWEEGPFADEFGDAPTEGKILPFRPKTPLH